jgi:hypothetical protein
MTCKHKTDSANVNVWCFLMHDRVIGLLFGNDRE